MTSDSPRAQLIHIETDRRLGHEWDEWDGKPLPGNGDFSAPPGVFLRYAGLTLALVAAGAAAARGEGRAAGADPALPLEAGVGRRAGDRGALRGAGVRRDAGAAGAPREPGAAPPRRGGGRVRAGHDDRAARCGGQAPGPGAHDALAQRAVPRRDARSGDDGALGAGPGGGGRVRALLRRPRHSESLLQSGHQLVRDLVSRLLPRQDHLEVSLGARRIVARAVHGLGREPGLAGHVRVGPEADLHRHREVRDVAFVVPRAARLGVVPRRLDVAVAHVEPRHLQALRRHQIRELRRDALGAGVEDRGGGAGVGPKVGTGGDGGAGGEHKANADCGFRIADWQWEVVVRLDTRPSNPQSAIRNPQSHQCLCGAESACSSPGACSCPAARFSISARMVAAGTPAACSNTSFPPITAVQMIATKPATPKRRSPTSSAPVSLARRNSFQASTAVKMPMVVSASVSCVSMSSWIASPCSITSSAWRPASTATQPPTTPAQSVHRAAALSDSRLKSQAPRSNSTVTKNSAAGRSFTAAWKRGQS